VIDYSTIIKNTVALISGRLISRIGKFFLLYYAARVLGVKEFGLFSFAFVLTHLVGISMDLGMFRYAIQQTSRNIKKVNYFSGACLKIKSMLIPLGIALIIIIAIIMDCDLQTIYILLILAGYKTFETLSTAFSFSFMAAQQMGYQARIISIVNILVAIGGLSLLYIKPNVMLLTSVYLVGGMLQFILSAKTSIRLYGSPEWTADYKSCRKLLNKSIPFSLVTIFVSLYYYIDTIILSAMTNIESVGYYNAAYRIIEAPLFLGAAFTSALFPAASKLFNIDKKQLLELVSKGFHKIMTLSISIGIVVSYFSEEIISIVFGADYQKAATILSILAFSISIIIPSTILGTSIRAIGRQTASVWVTGAGALLNITLNLIFIPRYSYIAAAWSTIATEVFVIVVYIILVIRYIGPLIDINYILRIIILNSILYGFLYFTADLWYGIQVAGIGFIYLPVACLTGVVKKEEIMRLLGNSPILKRRIS